MRRRPLCLLCLLWIASLLVADVFLGVLTPCGTSDAGWKKLSGKMPDAFVTGTVSRTAGKGDFSVCTLRKTYLKAGEAIIPIHNMEIRLPAGDYYPAGWILAAKGRAVRIEGPDNPGQYDAAFYAALNRCYYRMYEPEVRVIRSDTARFRESLNVLRERLRGRIREVFPEDCAGIMAALLIGDRSDLTSSDRSLFKNGGVMHILAISGLHLTLLGTYCFAGLKYIFFLAYGKTEERKQAAGIRGMGPGTGRAGIYSAGMLSVFLLGLYTILTGMSVSAVRAFLMFSVLTAGKMLGRTYDPPTAISFAALLILLENPLYLKTGGFQLSFLAAAAFYLFRKRGAVMALLLVQLWLLPLTLWLFFEMPLLSLPVNLLVVPLLPLLLISGAAGLLPVTGWAACPAIWILRSLAGLLRVVSAIPPSVRIMGRPHIYQIALYYCLLAAFTAWTYRWRILKRRFFLFLLVPGLVIMLARNAPVMLLRFIGIPSELKIAMLSVGQGDASVLQLPDGETVLLDGGSTTVGSPGRTRILPYLGYEGIGRLDYVVATHSDEDHVNGILEMLRLMEKRETPLVVRTIVLPYLRTPDARYLELEHLAGSMRIRVVKVRSGDCFTCGPKGQEVLLEVLNPDPSIETDPPDMNGQCVVLGLHYRQFDALFCGDVSGEGEEQMVGRMRKENAEGVLADYELLKVAHHGSRFSTPAELLSLITAETAVISSGEGNRYGHPHGELLMRLSKEGMRIERTDEHGAVTVVTDGMEYEVLEFHGA